MSGFLLSHLYLGLLLFVVCAECKDDGFDYDQSWEGRGQFWVYIGGPVADGDFEPDLAEELPDPEAPEKSWGEKLNAATRASPLTRRFSDSTYLYVFESASHWYFLL